MFSPKQMTIIFSVIALGLFSIQWNQKNSNSTPPIPLPTEHRQSQDAEKRHKLERRQWIEQMHRAAPGVDWRAIEQANGKQRQRIRREALADKTREEISPWTETGSRNQAGRMHAVALSATGDSLYGGSSRGGVWKGSLWGDDWRPLSDNLYGGAHGLAVAGGVGGNPEVVTSITDNGLVNFSEDGGTTWHFPSGLPSSINEAKRVAHDSADADRVYLMLRPSGVMVLYISTDAGRTYTQIYSLNTAAGDFWIDRVNGGDIYIMSGNQLLLSHNQGADWSTVGSIAEFSITQVVLTASEAGAPRFYAALKSDGQWKLHSSINGGIDWGFQYVINDFWNTLCASITNRNLVLFGGVELWRSVDGGTNFSIINNWWEYYDDPLNKLHADMPGLDCVMTDTGETFYIATDGGLYRSDDGMATVTNISLTGLGVSQYYDTHTSINDPDLILAGAQDQGYQRSDQANGNLTREFDQLISGDYGHITSGDGSHDIVFSVYPGFVLVQSGALDPTLPGLLDFPAGEAHSWIPFTLANPDNNREFYLCATHLYKGTWTGGSGVNYTPSAQNFAVGGSSYLTAVSISPVNHAQRLAVTNTGRLWYSFDGGGNWTDSGFSGPDAHYFYGTAIVHSYTDPLTAWVGGSGYSGPAVYNTRDGGITWASMGNRLPPTLVYGLALESTDNEVLYAATEAGPFRYDEDLGEWEYIGTTGVPLTTYWSVESVPADHLMRFGTYGRGIWDYDVNPPASAIENHTPMLSAFSLTNFPNPFNPSTTLRFNLERAGSAQIDIFDLAGHRLRRLHSGELAAGIHELTWDGRSSDGSWCPSAVYLATVKALGKTESLRITLAK
jgi:photosystem II stability/assembly factor-like uncharacterized protein